ncbi:acyl-coenzyme A thioesterase THEM4-like isoform X3 [Heteronotia binoei]|uniref:acyl-coenzyme A thioesterase THEM4-like isoform X3 n=1 Tax=Heteronotia binoei TaxID=13085 RepID=UPI00292E033C|nr:acyl-coenzyme A thioesterase THEM4-like isoform X3 [Heteronotia binoei]
MHLVLRSCGRLGAGWACRAAPRCGPRAQRALLGSALMPACNATIHIRLSEQAKDYALPNSSWSQEMMAQFNKYTEMSKDGKWKRLPSYRDVLDHMPSYQDLLDHMPEKMRREHVKIMDKERRMFLRSFDEEGQGFEYVMFMNPTEKRIVCVFQPGPFLEGPPGFTHGGSIASILDSTLGGCAISLMGRVMTANLSINFKNPVPLGSVVLAESRLDKVEGKKVFVSGQMRSSDGETLHAEATGLFIQLVPPKASQPPKGPK